MPLERVSVRRSVVLPALGRPTSPIAAIKFRTRKSRLRVARRLALRRREARVATTAVTPRDELHALSGLFEVGDLLVALDIEDEGARRNRDLTIVTVAAETLVAIARGAVLGLEQFVVAEIAEVILAAIADDPNAAAITTVATVGPTERYELLAPEGNGPASAVARLHADSNDVTEH